MRSIRTVLFCVALLIGFAGPRAAHAALPEGVTESSFVLPSGERVLELSIDVPAGTLDVWNSWATSEGFKSWAVPTTFIDFRAGGMMESSYDPNAKQGDRGNIKNAILVVVPQRLFVVHNVQTPEKTPFDGPTFQKTQTAVMLTPLGDKLTRVTVTNSGYAATGAEWDGVYKFFRDGNAYSLAQLRKRFVDGPVDWAKVFAPRAAPKK